MSGMHNYLKGKLPDCFLIDNSSHSPMSKKASVQMPQSDEVAAYGHDQPIMAVNSGSPFTKKTESDVNATRLHSACTLINNPNAETDTQSKHRSTQGGTKPPLIPIQAYPKRLLSGTPQPAFMLQNPLQQQYLPQMLTRKPVVHKKLQGIVFGNRAEDTQSQEEIGHNKVVARLVDLEKLGRDLLNNQSRTERSIQ